MRFAFLISFFVSASVSAAALLPPRELAKKNSHAAIAAAESDVKTFCDRDGRKPTCLRALLELRCHQLAFPDFFTGGKCAAAGKMLVRGLDLRTQNVVLEASDGTLQTLPLTIIFRDRLDALIESPFGRNYLSGLMVALRRASREGSPFDLWSHTFAYTREDSVAATELIAVFLQDTSRTKVQIFYLDDRAMAGTLTAEAESALGQLKVIQEIIREDHFRDREKPQWLTLYPKDPRFDGSTLTSSLYHFYPMARLAQILRAAEVNDGLAAFLPYLFNAEYEFQTLDPERWPLRTPAPFVLTPERLHQMHDLYAGWIGPAWALGEATAVPSLADELVAFPEDPVGSLRKRLFSR